MFNVTLVQPNFQTGPKHLNSYYLPYSVGSLWSYLIQNQQIKDNYQVDNWIFRREELQSVVDRCKNTDIVFISLYIWNKNYCLMLGKILKETYPNIKIILGGPELPHRNPNFLKENDYIDSIVIGEGELAVLEILTAYLDKKPLEQVYEFDRIQDLNLPSPYTLGLFDDLIKQHPDIEWVPTLETDRGCPYSCTFCDWGSATASKMYKIYDDRILADLQWVADNKLPYLALTSSNFGIFKDRDIMIADMIVKTNKDKGFPSGISVSYAKNSNDTVLEIVKKFIDVNIQTGITLSLQTTTEEVLENIKRKNMKINSIDEIIGSAKEKNVPALTELILGMPGETVKTWKTTLEQILINEIPTLDVYFLQLLVNSPMYVKQIQEYDLKTFYAYDFFYGVQNEKFEYDKKHKISESIEVIKSTNTISENEMEDVAVFTAFILGLHMFGISNIISTYLYQTQNKSYIEFYTQLYDHLKQNDIVLNGWLDQLKTGLQDWKKTGYMETTIDNVFIEGWKFFHSIMPIIQNNNLVEHYINVVGDFSKQFVTQDIIDDYIKISNLQIKQFESYIHDSVHVTVKSNLFPANLIISDRYGDYLDKKEDHLDMLFFGRRRGWHLNKISLDK